MQLGILECGPAPGAIAARHGSYPQMFARLLAGRGWAFPAWSVHAMEFPAGVDAADAWLLTGSRFGAYEDHAFIPPLEDFIRAARAARRPMLGICFGHQIMAQATGGRVEKAAQGWGVGRHVYQLDGHGPLALTAWHQDQVVRAPEDAAVIARSEFCPVAGLRYGDWGLSLQAHPEFGREVAADFVRLRRGDPAYPPERLDAAADALDAALDTDAAVALLAGFLQAAPGPRAGPAPGREARHG